MYYYFWLPLYDWPGCTYHLGQQDEFGSVYYPELSVVVQCFHSVGTEPRLGWGIHELPWNWIISTGLGRRGKQ